MKRLYSLMVAIIFLLSCRQAKKENDTVKAGNISTTISADTAMLARLIDLTTLKPAHVKFKYIFIDNSGRNQRLSVPGPSDSYLQAILYFDSATFKTWKAKYFNIDYPSPGFDKQGFNFDWLNTSVKAELSKSDTAYHGHPDYFLGGGSKLWMLDNKLLLLKSAN